MAHHNKTFPNESKEYRQRRNELLDYEIELRSQVEKLSKMRQSLPLGGILKEDYIFDAIINNKESKVKFSDLFVNNKNSLIVYSFMYGPNMEKPCPCCTSIIDTLNTNVKHVLERTNLVVVAKSPIQKSMKFAKARDWNDIKLLSSNSNSYNTAYFAENEKGEQIPALNVFRKTKDGIFHHYNTELLYANLDGHPRHVDSIWPIWNLFDMIPEGRGVDWLPKLDYKK